MHRSLLVCGVILSALSTILVSAPQHTPRYRLEIEDEFPVADLTPEPTLEPIKCDSRGSIYVRFYRASAYKSPVMKISADGKHKASFSLEKVPEWTEGEFTAFDVGADGLVYLLAVRPGKNRTLEHAVVVMKENGELSTVIPLRFSFRLDSLDHIAVFPRGEILLTGFREIEAMRPLQRETDSPTKPPDVEPIIGIFDRQGSLTTEVALSMDAAKQDVKSRSILRLLPMPAIHGASLTIYDDGNLYLMFRREVPQVHVISSDGAEVRAFQVTPPTEKAEAIDVSIAPQTGLLIFFAEKAGGSTYPANSMIFSLVNPYTGERVHDYQSNSRLGGALGCYNRGSFLFLGSSQGKFAVLKALPK